MRKFCSLVLFLLAFFPNFSHCDDIEEAEKANIHELVQEPLFVSLGSVCEVGHVLRACELRKAAFPFDWITTIDSEKFLEILRQDFDHFLDEEFFYVGGPPGPLYHTYYHMEFLHEGDFRGNLYATNVGQLKSKYQRRIERFRNLSEYKGKVFFLRAAYPHSTTDPHRLYYCADNLKITDDYSWELYKLLQGLFPNLDFTLIIINTYDGTEIYEEKYLTNNLIKIKANPDLDLSIKRDAYMRYFESLLEASR